MKIALINNLYFPFNRGGAEEVVKNMILELQNSGQEVFLITSKPRKNSKLTAKTELDAKTETKLNKNLKIYYLNSLFYKLDKIPLIFRFFWHLSNIIAFRKYYKTKKILQANKPNLVITHNLMGLGFSIPRAIKKLKIRHEHVLHDMQLLHPSGLMLLGQETKIDKLPAKIYQFFTRQLFASPSKIISPSNWLLAEHLKRGFFKNSSSEVKTFNFKEDRLSPPKILDVGFKNAKPREQLAGEFRGPELKKQSSITLLFVGQIEKHKGILWLINNFKKIAESRLKLIIVGTGKEIINANKLALSDQRIKLKGKLDPLEVKKVMTDSDYLIVPSLCYENAPRVIYEARALKLPILAAVIGGIPEIIGPQDKLFKAGDEKDFKKLILKISKKNLDIKN